MFCNKCGANLPDGAQFCATCGQTMATAPVANDATTVLNPDATTVLTPEMAAVVAPAPVAPKKDNKLMLVIIAAAAAVAVLLGCLLIFGGTSFQSLLDDNMAIITEGDLSNLEDLAPDCAWRRLLDRENVIIENLVESPTYAAAAERFAAQYNSLYSQVATLKYTVVDNRSVDQQMRAEVVEELLDSYGKYGLTTDMLGDVQILQVEIFAEANGSTDTKIEQLYAVEVEGDWYLLADEDSFFAYEITQELIEYAE